MAGQLGFLIPARSRPANGSNMLCLIIPCHRVIRADGTLCATAAAFGGRNGSSTTSDDGPRPDERLILLCDGADTRKSSALSPQDV